MSDHFVFNEVYLSQKRNAIKDEIAYVKYKIGDLLKIAPATSTVSGDTIKVEATLTNSGSASADITEITIATSSSDIATSAVSIKSVQPSESLLYIGNIQIFQAVSAHNTGEYDKA